MSNMKLFESKIALLRNDCVHTLIAGLPLGEKIDGFEGEGKWDGMGYRLPDACGYEGFVYYRGAMWLVQLGVHYSPRVIDLETLCKYVDLVIDKYHI